MHRLATLALVCLAGCASTYEEPPLPADHPANAVAKESPPPPRSRTLDPEAADPVAQTPAAPSKPKAPESPSAGAIYACPMHPEVRSDKPDQRCPECGMKLQLLEPK